MIYISTYGNIPAALYCNTPENGQRQFASAPDKGIRSQPKQKEDAHWTSSLTQNSKHRQKSGTEQTGPEFLLFGTHE